MQSLIKSTEGVFLEYCIEQILQTLEKKYYKH